MLLSREEYVQQYGCKVVRLCRGTGIFPQTVLAQSIIESQGNVDGIYRVGASKLATNANNYFGMKQGSWTGPVYNADTMEYSASSNTYDINASFRKYNDWSQSVRDYIANLRDHYPGVALAPTYQEQIRLIAAHGYSTNPNYATQVIALADKVNDLMNQYHINTRCSLLFPLLAVGAAVVVGIIAYEKQ